VRILTLLCTTIVLVHCVTAVSSAVITRKDGVWLGADALRAPGANAATLIKFGCDGAWEFQDNAERQISFNFRIPENINFDYPITFIIGWSSPTTSADCNFNISYTTTEVDEDTSVPCEYYQDIIITSSSVADGLTVSQITITEITEDDKCIHMQVLRDGNDPLDTINDDVYIHGLCFNNYIDYQIESHTGFTSNESWLAGLILISGIFGIIAFTRKRS